MGVDVALVERVRQALARRPDVVESRMVGGMSFLVGGSLCCGVAGDALVVRVGREGSTWALAQPHVRPLAFGGRPLAGYACVDPPGCATDAALAAWVQRSVDYVSTLRPS